MLLRGQKTHKGKVILVQELAQPAAVDSGYALLNRAIVLKGWMVVSCRSRCVRPSWLMGHGRHDHHVGHSLLPYQHLIGSNIPHQGQHKAVMGPQENIELAFAQPGIEKGSHNVLQHSLHSSTRCLSFHVEWQVELRKDKEGLDTVGILLAQHHAHQSAWHHVEAHLSVLYVFWNKGVTCTFFLQRAHQHASAGFGRQRAFMQKLLLAWLLTPYKQGRLQFNGSSSTPSNLRRRSRIFPLFPTPTKWSLAR